MGEKTCIRTTRSAVSLLGLGIFLAAPLFAQTLKPEPLSKRTPASKPATQRLLSFEGSQAIVEAAREGRYQARGANDCSHLVNEIYQRAGFEYPYANSRELYAGVASFERVKQPQRGDLVVWPGHVGIVVDPVIRAFYSSVRPGLRLDFYDSPYWRRRGPARFYRYIARNPEPPKGSITQAHLREKPAAGEARPQVAVREEGNRMPVRTSAGAASDANVIADWPDRITFRPAKDKPTKEEISKALSDLVGLAGEALRDRDLLKQGRPVAIVDQLQVDRLELKGRRARAWIRANLRLSIAGGRVDDSRSLEMRQWELTKKGGEWTLVAPQGRAYLYQDAALSILASQLATLTQHPQTTVDYDQMAKRQIAAVRMLSALVERE